MEQSTPEAGKIYAVAGMGPMKMVEPSSDGTCVLKTLWGHDYFASHHSIVREVDEAYVTFYIEQLISRQVVSSGFTPKWDE
jgi:hypothetical protein